MKRKYKKTTFGELKRGDRFALSEGSSENMKVDPAVLCASDIDHIPFNVISLTDGRVRTFREDERVLGIELQD